jgi:hypothetical protein
MKWIISGQAYNAESLQDMSLADLLAVRRQTGMSMGEVTAALESTAPAEGTSADLDVTEMDEQQLVAMSVLFWHARKAAGECLTIEQAADFPLRTLSVELEPGDVEDEAPNRAARRARATSKTAPASARAKKATPGSSPRTGRTTTSRRPSTSA